MPKADVWSSRLVLAQDDFAIGEERLVLDRKGALTVLSACGVWFEFITDSELTTSACCSRLNLEISSF